MAAAHLADDAVAGYRVAAGGGLQRDAVDGLDDDGGGVRGQGRGDGAAAGAAADVERDGPCHDRGQFQAQADVGVEIGEGLGGGVAGGLVQHGGIQLVDVDAQAGQRLGHQPAAQFDGFVVLHAPQEVANLGAGLAGTGEGEPGGAGARVGIGDDLDDVAVGELGAQRYRVAVDAGSHALVAQVGVHAVGEVDDGGAPRQAPDLALGREDVDGVGVEVDLDVIDEFQRVAGLLLDVEQRLEPVQCLDLLVAGVFALGLVEPVGGDAGFGDAVHLGRADLELDAAAVRADHGGVQRLVAVLLGDGDEVLEAAGVGLEGAVDGAQCQVAGGQVGHDQAHAEEVVDLGERDVLVHHLAIDGVERFFAGADFGLHAHSGQRLLDGAGDAAEGVASRARGHLHGLGQRAIAQWVLVAEGQVLQFAEQAVQPQPVGDGGVDLDGLVGDAHLTVAADGIERAHVVQSVSQLDQDDAHVTRHGQQHLAEGLGLGGFAAAELHLVELGQAVDHLGHDAAELLVEFGLADGSVFQRVVQQGGAQGVRVELPAGADERHRDGMGDVGFAAGALLAAVGLLGQPEGAADALQVGLGQVGTSLGQQGLK